MSAVKLEIIRVDIEHPHELQRSFRFEVMLRDDSGEVERREIEQLLDAWYLVGFHGGYGGGRYGAFVDKSNVEWMSDRHFRFVVVGIASDEALDVLKRSFEFFEGDDVDFESVQVTVEHVSPKDGAGDVLRRART